MGCLFIRSIPFLYMTVSLLGSTVSSLIDSSSKRVKEQPTCSITAIFLYMHADNRFLGDNMTQKVFCLSLIAITLTVAPAVNAALYQVGPGRTYTTLQQVADLLGPGDVVEVDGNHTYSGGVTFTKSGASDQKITIHGIEVAGNLPVISGGINSVAFTTSSPYSGPGADHYVFEGFEVTGGSSRCIYHQADDLTVRNVVVHDCPAHGILGADRGSGSIVVEFTEIYNCGNGGSQHQIYMATDEVNRPGSVFRLQYSYIHDGNGGNNVKSRSERNEIYYNWIEGAYYHELELIGPDPGGVADGWSESLAREDSDVVGNVLRKTNDRSFITRVGGDGTGQSWGRYRFVNNTVITNDNAVFRIFDGIESIEMHNNVFYSDSDAVNMIRQVEAEWTDGTAVIGGASNWVKTGASNVPSQWTATRYASAPDFVDFAGLNLRPVAGSVQLVDQAGTSPSSPAGHYFPSPLFPPLNHPPERIVSNDGSTAPRPDNGSLDIGAFESDIVIAQGDIDGDGGVDLRDAILSLQAVTGNEVEEIVPDFQSSGADVGDDGKLSLQEAIYILQEAAE